MGLGGGIDAIDGRVLVAGLTFSPTVTPIDLPVELPFEIRRSPFEQIQFTFQRLTPWKQVDESVAQARAVFTERIDGDTASPAQPGDATLAARAR